MYSLARTYFIAFNSSRYDKSKKADKGLITELLCSSFYDNPSVNYLVSDGKDKTHRLRGLMGYAFEQRMRFGEVWLSEDRKACALLMFPQNKRTSWSSVMLDLKLILAVLGLGRINKVLRRERLIAGKHPECPMGYLWFIGVDSHFQHAERGSLLLGQLMTHLDKLQLPVYLETSVPENLPWYERFGFKVYDELDLGYRLFFLSKSV